ncbi:MAG TPA: TetR/AcrR family transcriptional regulator [Roseiarcus sp.]|nr:TetR/AcrR family transcriptional regulator [Roseiarcus sp.]
MGPNVQKRAAGCGQSEKIGLPEDRRIRRTRQALHHAMISLVLERGYEAVTIKDIVARANVGRSTFYAHYPSKEDLLTAEIEGLRATLAAPQRAALALGGGVFVRSVGFSRALFDHAQHYRDVYRALVGERGAAIIIARMRALFTPLVRDELGELLPPPAQADVPRSALVQFVVGSLMSILTWWLEADGAGYVPLRHDPRPRFRAVVLHRRQRRHGAQEGPRAHAREPDAKHEIAVGL